jgi:hypothetical protein
LVRRGSNEIPCKPFAILAVNDEPDVDVLFRKQFRRDLRAYRFTMEFAQSAPRPFSVLPMQVTVHSF